MELRPSIPSFPCIIIAGVVVALMVSAMVATKCDLKVISVFRRARLSGHTRKTECVSVMPPSDMDITPVKEGETLVLHVTGRIDSLTSDRFLKTVCEHADCGARHIRIDAGQVIYISSLGLRVLLQSHRKLTALGGTFKVRSASSSVLQIIFMAGMDALLENRS